MIINKEYLVQRANKFIQEKQESNVVNKAKADKLFNIKQRFPNWLRSIVFHPFNPVYSVYLQHKVSKKNNKKEFIQISQLHPYSTDYLKYFQQNEVNFDISKYYPQEDVREIEEFIDNHIRSLIPGYSQTPIQNTHKEAMKRRNSLLRMVRKVKNGYQLRLDGIDYVLPYSYFDENIYIHEYGLKYMPEYVKQYIKGKVFLDLGAFIGDASILLCKKYHPEHLYAYEPVSENLDNLYKTINTNAPCKITAVQKGMGDKETEINIFINPNQLSSCSINETMHKTEGLREAIQITTIDKECLDRKVGLIKMDIEGAEYGAILGGMETIKRDKPILLISLYHTAKDFFEIPPMLKDAVPDYKFRFINLDSLQPTLEKILIAYPENV